jgi:murein DD-endopeptidase MepM/ murein hydrolase activator NlpD
MRSESSSRRYLTIMLVPDRSQESRNYRLSYTLLRMLAGVAALVALALTLVAGSWWYLAARAARATQLEEQVRTLEAERDRIQELATQLENIERQYGKVRDLFGLSAPDSPSDVWLPPLGEGRRPPTPRNTATASIPSSWPLTERGFITQGLLDMGDHPGVDIAVPTDSYVRASGAGTVVDVGEDPVYGLFVVLDHGEGYTSLYGHASQTLVSRGQRVRRNEVIALSGSTGRSTAPHLHFEILLNGEAVDPLTLAHQP